MENMIKNNLIDYFTYLDTASKLKRSKPIDGRNSLGE